MRISSSRRRAGVEGGVFDSRRIEAEQFVNNGTSVARRNVLRNELTGWTNDHIALENPIESAGGKVNGRNEDESEEGSRRRKGIERRSRDWSFGLSRVNDYRLKPRKTLKASPSSFGISRGARRKEPERDSVNARNLRTPRFWVDHEGGERVSRANTAGLSQSILKFRLVILWPDRSIEPVGYKIVLKIMPLFMPLFNVANGHSIENCTGNSGGALTLVPD